MAIPQPPAQKFLFNRSFDNLQAESAQPKEPPPPTYSQAELDAARDGAIQQGFAAGQERAQQTQQAHLLAATETLTAQIGDMLARATAAHLRTLGHPQPPGGRGADGLPARERTPLR